MISKSTKAKRRRNREVYAMLGSLRMKPEMVIDNTGENKYQILYRVYSLEGRVRGRPYGSKPEAVKAIARISSLVWSKQKRGP